MTVELDYFDRVPGEIREFYERKRESLLALDVKPEIGLERFTEDFSLEDFAFVYRYTDWAGFHATDPNWYEEGQYGTALIRPGLFRYLESLLRQAGLFEEGQVMTPICHYSENPGEAWLFPFHINSAIPRPNLIITVEGGEKDDWGQFVCINLTERRFFNTTIDHDFINSTFEGAVG